MRAALASRSVYTCCISLTSCSSCSTRAASCSSSSPCAAFALASSSCCCAALRSSWPSLSSPSISFASLSRSPVRCPSRIPLFARSLMLFILAVLAFTDSSACSRPLAKLSSWPERRPSSRFFLAFALMSCIAVEVDAWSAPAAGSRTSEMLLSNFSCRVSWSSATGAGGGGGAATSSGGASSYIGSSSSYSSRLVVGLSRTSAGRLGIPICCSRWNWEYTLLFPRWTVAKLLTPFTSAELMLEANVLGRGSSSVTGVRGRVGLAVDMAAMGAKT
mmetsp:Transcript_68149/g.156374  ORF Transcript_68149/g.156374 Transcript_68149/m.156374 type:complete len:275 (+) Transcript_68149:637-1461(+)